MKRWMISFSDGVRNWGHDIIEAESEGLAAAKHRNRHALHDMPFRPNSIVVTECIDMGAHYGFDYTTLVRLELEEFKNALA